MKTATRIILGFLLSATLGLSPALAEWYVGGYAGVAIPSDEDVVTKTNIPGFVVPDVTFQDVDLNTSAVFGGKGGYFFEGVPFWTNFGLELEVYHFNPDADAQIVTASALGVSVPGVPIVANDIAVTTIGLNALYRLQLSQSDEYPRGQFQPYAGVGLGIFIANLETIAITTIDDDTDTALGFQALAGLKYFFIPNLSLFAEYKFIQTGDFEFEFSETVAGVPVNLTLEADLTSHLFYGGIAYHF